MRTDHATTPKVGNQRRCVGVGIDTSRYGHYAAFLRDDLQPAAAELQFAESAKGYAAFRQRLEQIVERQGAVHPSGLAPAARSAPGANRLTIPNHAEET